MITVTNPDPTGIYYLAVFVNPNVLDAPDLPGGVPTTSIFHYNNLAVSEFTGDTYCSGVHTGSFWRPTNIDCEQRTGTWALDISGTGVSVASLYPAASAPEPSTLALILAGLAGIAPFARRRFVQR